MSSRSERLKDLSLCYGGTVLGRPGLRHEFVKKLLKREKPDESGKKESGLGELTF